MLDDRRSEILRSLVECHIRTGAPASSTMVLENSDLEVSPATVRKELALLEEDGYAAQPHTSAGRVPTALGYRFYVDNQVAFQLRRAVRSRISSFFSEVELELDRLLHATSRLLSDVTRLPAVVVGPHLAAERIRSINLVSLQLRLALLVVVTESARVLQEICRLPAPLTGEEVSEMETLLRSHALGAPLGLPAPPALAPPGVPPTPFGSCFQEVWATLERAAVRASDVYVMGTGRLADLWDDLDAVSQVLGVLEREAAVLDLLASDPGINIRIGEEIPDLEMDLAVVSTSFLAGNSSGRIGVLGPMRMNYGRAISVVQRVSAGLADRIGV
ncbi:MAG: heat-inducible transcriptional repressor HrcA [bacterium]|nr:heat-inducible transcriptional repressor HrcA [Acidimicrobiia bacterium]MCY4650230.1 heat-inducible transcriptional repressor HrcA [bacterium]